MARAAIHYSLLILFTSTQVLLWQAAMGPHGGWYFWPLLTANTTALVFMWFTLGFLTHEAAHSHLSPHRRLNEMIFGLTGLISYGSPTLYRLVHFSHHGFTNLPQDLEFHPSVLKASNPRKTRRRILRYVVFSGFELFRHQQRALLDKRGVLRPEHRRRCRQEAFLSALLFFAIAACWCYTISPTSWLIAYLLPLVTASWLHGWPNLCQHYGMAVGRAPDVSRDVVPQSLVGRVICWFFFNENYHSAHHAAPHVPAAKLPEFYRGWTERLRKEGKVVPPSFRSYNEILRTQVIPLLIRDLSVPKVP